MKTKSFLIIALITLFMVLFVYNASYGTVTFYINWDGDASFPSITGSTTCNWIETRIETNYPNLTVDSCTCTCTPLPAFNAHDLNTAWTDNGTDEENIKTEVVERIKADFYDFDIEVTTTLPTGNFLQIGVGSDDCFYQVHDTIGNISTGWLYGLAPVNNSSIDNDTARVWVGSLTLSPEFQGANATVERFINGISGTLAHEAGHTYNLAHGQTYPALGESYTDPGGVPQLCNDNDHIMNTGEINLTAADRATIDRHFSTGSYRELALNIGLKLRHLRNSDFVNTNTSSAYDFHIHFYSTASDLDTAGKYTVTYPFGHVHLLRPNPFKDFTTRKIRTVPNAELSPVIVNISAGPWYEYAAEWSNPDWDPDNPPATDPVPPGGMIHLGVSYHGATIFVRDAYFTDINGIQLPSRPVFLAHNIEYIQPDLGGDLGGNFFVKLYNFSNIPVFITNITYSLSSRLIPIEDLIYDDIWMNDPNKWKLICSPLAIVGELPTFAYGPWLDGACGRIDPDETREIFIDNASTLIEEILSQGPFYHSQNIVMDASEGVPDPDSFFAAQAPPYYIDRLFPDTYVIVQYDLYLYTDPNTDTIDTANPIHEVLEVAGVNPLGNPNVSSISPTTGTQGETLSIEVKGSNFLTGANLEFSGTGITVEKVTVEDFYTISAQIKIASNAGATSRDISVINPHSQIGVLQNAFTIISKEPPTQPICPQPCYPGYLVESSYYYSPPTYNYFNYSPVTNIGIPFHAVTDSTSTQASVSVSGYYPSWPTYYGYGLYGLYGSYFPWTYPYYYMYPWYSYPRYYTIKRYPSYSFSYSSSETSSVIGNSPDVLNYTFGSNYSNVNISITNY